MKLYTYLNYGGNCRQAFEFYAAHLGGRITMMSTHADLPDQSHATPENRNDVLHARLELGETSVMGADVPKERFKPMRSAYLTLILDSNEEAERVYGLLAENGEIFMKLEETFYAHRFAMLRDRFGTSWMLLHEKPM